ncbi:MAG: 2-oxoacid:acceptor oxidoreductase subunit alpha [Rhodospirillales bacterium]|nr:2-oxoacid:acceptor oxidoreductase subunit alpha [Rhodospirillales bacterium]
MSAETISIAVTGAGGAGVMTAGQMLLDAGAKAGWYGLMTRSSGPQIRGGEAAAFLRMSPGPVNCGDDKLHILFAFDWMNVERFAAELFLNSDTLVLCDSDAGEVPNVISSSGARVVALPLKKTVKEVEGGRINMIGLGVLGKLVGLPDEAVDAVISSALKKKGQEAIDFSKAGYKAGFDLAANVECDAALSACSTDGVERWGISGNEAAGLGGLKGGVRFVAAYPITPATEVLEWLAPNLEKVGGTLVQAEDELASIVQIIGGSFGGTPSMTATSGPGLALMMEAMGLAVASETPIVVVNVQRGGPSTGIPTKSEQSDLNIALHGLHGDAPHIVTAPNSIPDCLFTTQWSVFLAERLQTAAIVLSDQALGQSRVVCDKPADLAFIAKRDVVEANVENYERYSVTASGVSPMAIPGTPGGEYVADGLEHAPNARPSSAAEDHIEQLDKRDRKLTQFDYGNHWADIEGEGEMAVITWGSTTAPVREAIERAEAKGMKIRMISMRLLMPMQTEKFAEALKGVTKALVIEQTHSKQFFHYLKAYYDLPAEVKLFNRPGPLPMRPGEILEQIESWS